MAPTAGSALKFTTTIFSRFAWLGGKAVAVDVIGGAVPRDFGNQC